MMISRNSSYQLLDSVLVSFVHVFLVRNKESDTTVHKGCQDDQEGTDDEEHSRGQVVKDEEREDGGHYDGD